jgi:ribosome assembly protein YihI (activator of Der GTPase)
MRAPQAGVGAGASPHRRKPCLEAQPEVRRLEELRLSALQDRIEAELELGLLDQLWVK